MENFKVCIGVGQKFGFSKQMLWMIVKFTISVPLFAK